MINPKYNKPMRKVNIGDVEDHARTKKESLEFMTGETFEQNYDQINWRSKQNLPPLAGNKVRSVTHAQAGLPVWGDP